MKRLIFSPKHLNSQKCLLIEVKRAIFILFLLIIGLNTYGQTVFELKTKLDEMKGSGDTLIIEEADHINRLITDFQPTVYVGDVVKTSNESLPVRANVQAGAVAKLNIQNPLFGLVELINVRIDSPADLITILDLSLIQGFTSLKYVRVLCSFECAPEQLGAIVTGNTSGIKVFYSISIPS
jgi:hypothetical protein